MKKRRLIILSLLVLLLAATGIWMSRAYCIADIVSDEAYQDELSASAHTDCQPCIDRIRERGVLLVGTTGDYHPLTFLESDGRYTGFGIEIAEAIAKELGVGIRFVPTSWPTLTADVMDNPQKFDLAIGGITITEERFEAMLMSERYLANGKTILCRRSDADRYRSQEKARAARLILLFQT